MPLIAYIFIFLFGLAIGSFLNCLIWRLHTGEGMGGRSYCPKCKHTIAWYDNLPLLSFALLKGKCRHCGRRISWQYPAVELITGVLFATAFILEFGMRNSEFGSIIDSAFRIPNSAFATFSFPHSALVLFRDFFLISVMIVIFVIDLRWYLILDIITLPACFVMIILNLILGASWQNMVISGIIGASFFLIQFLISQGKWIGGGDIRLGLLMGFALGWPNIMVAILIAYLLGSVIGLVLILTGRKKWSSKLPLGVFLSTATIIALFWGEKIINWYMNIFL